MLTQYSILNNKITIVLQWVYCSTIVTHYENLKKLKLGKSWNFLQNKKFGHLYRSIAIAILYGSYSLLKTNLYLYLSTGVSQINCRHLYLKQKISKIYSTTFCSMINISFKSHTFLITIFPWFLSKYEVKPKLKILWKIWHQVGKACIEFVEDLLRLKNELKIFSNIFRVLSERYFSLIDCYSYF